MKHVTQTITKTASLSVNTDINIDTNDIFNWLTKCDDPETLRYLGKYANRRARCLNKPDEDDFRSRA